MRVLISCITYHPTVGGADDFVRSIAEGVAAARHEVLVVASDLQQHVAGVKLADIRPRRMNGVRIVRCQSRNMPGHVYPVWPGFFSHAKSFKPDVVHGFGLGYWSADAAARLRSSCPVIISPTGGRYRSGRLYGLLRASLLKDTLQADLWTALSLDEREALREAHPGSPRIEILSPSIVPAEWTRERLDPFPDVPRPRVLFAGRLSRDKGVFDLIEAVGLARRTCEARLLIVGPDYGAGELPPSDGVHYAGELDREKLVAAYQHCDLLVLPSYHEGFGIVLLEAGAAGKPVIAYDNSSMPELCRHNENGLLVETGSVEALGSAIASLLSNPSLAGRMGARGREIAFRDYSRSAMVERVLGYYKEALGRMS
ncbi:MAG: glycosyltransferase family 4 protein [Candidatus Hydrogenedentota bacterium]